MYYKLKTSFLEDTLNDVLSDDGFDVLEMSLRDGELDVSVTESINGGPQIPLDITKLVEQQQQETAIENQNLNDFSNIPEQTGSLVLTNLTNNAESHPLREFEAVGKLALNDKAWSPAEKSKLEENEIKKITRKSLKPNFKEKLFENTSFSKRNPRKSLTKSVLDNSIQGNRSNFNEDKNTNKEVLPDLETILLQKAKEQQTSAGIAVNPLLTVEKSKENIKIEVDEGWLERNAIQNGIKTRVTIEKKLEKASIEKKSSYGLSNLDVSKFTTLQPLESQPITNFGRNNKKNKKSEIESIESSKFKEMPVEHSIDPKRPFKSEESHSDSVVDDSEEEKESQEYRHIVKRRRIMNTTPSQNEEQNIKTGSVKEATSNIDKEYSPASNENEDYVEKNKKGKRKTTVDQKNTARGKQKAGTKENKSKVFASIRKTRASSRKKSVTSNAEMTVEELTEHPFKTEDFKHPTSLDKSNNLKQKKTRTMENKRTRANTRQTKEPKCDENEELTEETLNPEDIKYSLALEGGDITSVPRLKLTDLDKADILAQEYINTFPVSGKSLKPIPVTVADIKRAAAKRKLEEKIASGKLNENFVTINIQKKTFVRGKKTINYSKYKKKLWKHKKHIAALTGPNMDMGGCDGGTLKCFNCGQAGHFAQNCKVKGDSLLPLTAQLEEDPSPFPTLQEAERMANETAIAVHSRNISRLPQAANAALYQTVEKSTDVESTENEIDEVYIIYYI